VNLETPISPASSREAAAAPLSRAVEHLIRVQYPSGHWEAEMVWNSMLLSQWVMVQHMTGRLGAVDAATRARILQQYEVTRTRDGAWGMHRESEGYVFMTALAYVALRLLGLPPDHALVAPAREWLRRRDVRAIPSWGKLWLAMLGLYGWEGVNPIPPELFLLPEWMPLHPNNFYCHTRYIYLGIAFLYGQRFSVELGALGDELRAELYEQPYAQIDFARHRHDIAKSDLYVEPSWPLRAAYDLLHSYERRAVASLRKRALAHCFERIVYEQEASRGQGLSPVNGLLNCLALYIEGHPAFESSLQAMQAWKWEDAAEGIRYCGARSNSWDTAFALRALAEAPAALTPDAVTALRSGYAWLRDAQMQEELPAGGARQKREPILGGWCFSDGKHRWAVSDCTAEAMSAILRAHELPGLLPEAMERLSQQRLTQAARFILRRQNGDGGFGSYEPRRGSLILEWINPSEMYGNCMTERSYTECTASCVGALARFRRHYPNVMSSEIGGAIDRGLELLRARQLDDGSYLGFWGVNFTYAIFHVVEALRAAGVPASDAAIARAIDWLLAKQKPDGGWGEHADSCLTDRYIEHPESQAAMSAWALLALMEALPIDHSAINRGIGFLRQLQLPDGQWPQQSQSGVFFATAMLDYRLYKDYFPAWALARHATLSQ
jgi:lanosterol synthase